MPSFLRTASEQQDTLPGHLRPLSAADTSLLSRSPPAHARPHRRHSDEKNDTPAPRAASTGFWVFRERVNPKATIGDFLYILATVAIVGNVVSILVFKTRFF